MKSLPKKPRPDKDPIESMIEAAFQPERFIEDGACFAFVNGLETTLGSINELAVKEPNRATELFEVVLACCHRKVDNLDDSSGSFGRFVKDVIGHWIRVREKSGADPAATVSIFLSWMDDDPYAFCFEIEKDVCRAFGRQGLMAFEGAIRERYEREAGSLDSDRRRCGQILRAIYLEQGNASAYRKLAEETGLTPEDCLALAGMFPSQPPALALDWVNRGLAFKGYSGAKYELQKLQRELLAKLGRGMEALESAWNEYRKHPSKSSFDDVLHFAPAGERETWRERALDATEGGDLDAVMRLFIEVQDWVRLVRRIDGATDAALENVSHYVTEPAAHALEPNYPAVAARLWRAQSFRIVNAGKSKYYDAAIDNLERAKQCFDRAGLAGEWDKTVAEIRRTHFRKIGFMRDFEVLARGGSLERPTFLDLAKSKWRSRGRG